MSQYRILAFLLGGLSAVYAWFLYAHVIPLVGLLTDGWRDVIHAERAAYMYVVWVNLLLGAAFLYLGFRPSSRRNLSVLMCVFALSVVAFFAVGHYFDYYYWGPIGRGG